MFFKTRSICLISLASFCFTVTANANDNKTASATKAPAEVHSLTLGTLELQAEEIDFKIQRDGKHVIKLEGQAGINCGGIRVSADSIDATYLKQKDLMLNLLGNVKIISEHDRLHATALEATFDFGSKSLMLKAAEGKNVTLTRGNGSKTTQIEASQIEIQYQDKDSVLLKALGSVSLTEKTAKLKSGVQFRSRLPSKSDDFFNPSFFEPRPKPIKKQHNTSGAFFDLPNKKSATSK
ncbi:hypothetical protein [Gimesia aquarii]|uniref:Auto-transporter adhesin head GIN domain-containing protein n=1 Tax=Gimesia aquarii TaxID=2527964 RepID=A0A517W2L2_9PLAN|nr:hypothetical protein [Gimesia aquarii]QDT99495.1 hypothetical protein V144x_50060 [Gimesia aquarii]